MSKVWVVVASSSQANIYRNNSNALVEHAILYHDEGRMPAHDLVSDGYGRDSNSSYYGSVPREQKTPIKVKEAHIFADIIADFLEKGLKTAEYEKIYLIAKAPFLGHLRQSLTRNVTKLITAEINKELMQATPAEIREYLPPVL